MRNAGHEYRRGRERAEPRARQPPPSWKGQVTLQEAPTVDPDFLPAVGSHRSAPVSRLRILYAEDEAERCRVRGDGGALGTAVAEPATAGTRPARNHGG